MILNVSLNFMFLHVSGDTFPYKSRDVHLNFWQPRRNFNKRKLIRLMSSRCFKKPLRFEMKRNEECYKFVNMLSSAARLQAALWRAATAELQSAQTKIRSTDFSKRFREVTFMSSLLKPVKEIYKHWIWMLRSVKIFWNAVLAKKSKVAFIS